MPFDGEAPRAPYPPKAQSVPQQIADLQRQMRALQRKIDPAGRGDLEDVVPGLQNVVYYPPGDYITDTFEIDAPVAQVILNGAGTGPADEIAHGVLSTSHDSSAWVAPTLFVGGTGYYLIPIVRWVTSLDGGPIGSFTFVAAVDLLDATGTYSVNVQVAW